MGGNAVRYFACMGVITGSGIGMLDINGRMAERWISYIGIERSAWLAGMKDLQIMS